MPKNQEPKKSDPVTDKYIPCPAALNILKRRLSATPEEIAAWVFMGPEAGGIACFMNANELDSPPRFAFDPDDPDEVGYNGQLMGCWFLKDELLKFEPEDRYMTGKELIERWKKVDGIQPKAFIVAKVRESQLMDFHPLFGSTQATQPEDTHLPPLEDGLYLLDHVEEIELNDFRQNHGEPNLRKGTEDWLSERGKAGAEGRYGQPGGSWELQKDARMLFLKCEHGNKSRFGREMSEKYNREPDTIVGWLDKLKHPRKSTS